MRSLHKLWKDKRSGYTRRVRWFEGVKHSIEWHGPGSDAAFTEIETPDIRLNFEDEVGSRNEFFSDRDAAQTQYDNFRNGTRNALP